MRWSMHANSTAMKPPPSITMDRGSAGRSKASSETIASSAPGMSGRNGRPPVAIRMRSACTLRSGSVRRTVLGPSSTARESTVVTPADCRLLR